MIPRRVLYDCHVCHEFPIPLVVVVDVDVIICMYVLYRRLHSFHVVSSDRLDLVLHIFYTTK